MSVSHAKEDNMAEEKNEAAAAPKKDRSGLFAIGFIVLDVLVMGAATFLVFKATLGHNVEAVVEEFEMASLELSRKNSEENPVMYTMDPFIVNLAGEPQKSLQLEINVEMLGEDGFEELIRLGPDTRDKIVSLLSQKNFSELESIQGKLFLKDQIASNINSFLTTGVVKEIYFTSFLVQ